MTSRLVVLLALLVAAFSTDLAAISVERLQGRPFKVALDCRAPMPPDAQQVRIEAPPEGWPRWEQSVLVLDAPPGKVTLRRGDEWSCGLSWDARSTDARLRSGVGAQFRAAPGSREPIIVTAPSKETVGWALTVRYGDPAALQREDTLRFAIRIGGFSVLVAMLLSLLLLFANIRDRTPLMLAFVIATFALWIGMRSGLSGWPAPWLPSAGMVEAALMMLPPFGLAMLWSTAILFADLERLYPRLRYSHAIVAGLAVGTTVFGWAWPDSREMIYPTLRGVSFLTLAALIPLLLLALHRGLSGALPVLVALVPPLLVIGPLYDDVLRAWRAEAMLVASAWLAITLTIALSQRIGGLRRQRDQLKALAERDPLTGLPNRRSLAEALPRRIDEARAQGRPLSLAFMDLDRFKSINDRHGHRVGDEVLVEVSRRLSDRLRGGEVAARQGGEEFVLVLPGADAERARGVSERLRREIAETPIATSAGPLSVTASFGVSSLADADSRPETLLARADAAMYRAKQAGRNRVEVDGPPAAPSGR